MSDAFRLFVPGTPAGQGSKRHVGNGVMVESSKFLRPWRDLIVTMCLQRYTEEIILPPRFVGPVSVDLVFNFPRPKSHFRTGTHSDQLRDAAPVFPRTVGDIDKLQRAVFDALGQKHGAGVIADDADVVHVTADKWYGDRENPVGVHITVRAAVRQP